MNRQIVNIADLNRSIAQRGRKSTVTPEDIATAQSLDIGEAFEVPEADENGSDFSAYLREAIAKDPTKDEATVRNAWQSRFRQRAVALAKASGVDMTAVFTNDGGCYFARRA